MIHFRPLFQIPSCLQHLYRKVLWRGDLSCRCVYLTFDDGPIPDVTPTVLDILDQYRVKATFFCVGDNVARYPDLAREVLSRGHQIGNHTYHHLRGLQSTTSTYVADTEQCETTLQSVLHTPSSHLFRPPHGRTRYAQRRWLMSHGYQVVLWDVLTHDYNPSYTPADILSIVQRYTRNGSIIVFHDSIKAADNMLSALPQVIEMLKKQGYEFRTL